MAIKRKHLDILFVVPLLLMFLVFIIYPFLSTFRLSFLKDSLSSQKQFIGFGNYIRFLKGDNVPAIMRHTIEWTLGATALKVLSGFLVALLLNRKFKIKGIVMVIVLLPWAMPFSVSHIVWRWFFDSLYGHLNALLLITRIIEVPMDWLSNPDFAMWGVVIANSWTGMPFCAFTILAGLYSISKELYEAASMDGAGALVKFWYITLPIIKPILALVTALAFIWTFTNFGAVWLMTKGGPMRSTTTIIVEIYLGAFQNLRPNYASAVSVISAFFLFVVALMYVKIGKKNQL
jgi:multiple sugar transport system permease protein